MTAARCDRCGAAVAPPEPCAACLLNLALEPSVPDLTGTWIGGHEIIRKLGQGGMGVVYEAVDRRPASCRHNLTVALKILVADTGAPDQLLREAQLAASLQHDNIVRVYEAGEDEGIAYLVMMLIEGKPLSTPEPDPRRAARVTLDVARAVGFANRHYIAHRDLKPQNVLVEEGSGRVFVTDFGLAAREGPGAGAVIVRGGTPGYMAPEVLRGEAGSDSTAADVWGVGAILHDLLMGRPPYEAVTTEELERVVAEDRPWPPRVLAGQPAGLAAVCRRCLEKDPARRYPTADAVADDLQLFLEHKPTSGEPRPSRLARAASWCRRNPAAAVVFGCAALATVAFSLWAFEGARAQERARRDEVLTANVYAARAVAGTVLVQLNEYAEWVPAEARDPALVAALATSDNDALQALCQAIQARHGGASSPVSWWFVEDASGSVRAIFPASPFGKTYYIDFRFRDYFRGAIALPAGMDRPVYLSRVFRSTTDERYKVALGSPIRGEGGVVLGILIAGIDTDRHLGALRLSDDRRIVALTARRDRYMASDAMPTEHLLLVHDGVEKGEGIVVESAALQRLAARRDAESTAGRDQLRLPPAEWVEADGDYQDPLAERDVHGARGPWLAGMAAVGNTELTVVVQTRLDDARRLDQTPFRILASWSAGGAALLLAWLLAVLRKKR